MLLTPRLLKRLSLQENQSDHNLQLNRGRPLGRSRGPASNFCAPARSRRSSAVAIDRNSAFRFATQYRSGCASGCRQICPVPSSADGQPAIPSIVASHIVVLFTVGLLAGGPGRRGGCPVPLIEIEFVATHGHNPDSSMDIPLMRRWTESTELAEEARLVDLGGVLHRLHFWSPDEWDALPVARRPKLATYRPDLACWVGAVPLPERNQ
jgi:hypothetical protein